MSAFGEQHSGFEHMRELLRNFHRHEHVFCLFILHVVIKKICMCVFKLTLFVAKALVQHVKHAGAVGAGTTTDY